MSLEEMENHKQDRGICKANFQLAGECIKTCEQLSEWCKEIFSNELYAERIAHTLNFVLMNLVGQDSHRIGVKDPESIGFKPIALLKELCTIYANLAGIAHFCKSVVKDDRSFRQEYFN